MRRSRPSTRRTRPERESYFPGSVVARAMTLLENPDENPCFGCGPKHARGLHLNFERDGDAVVSHYTAKPDEIGWPGIMHTGLHFTTLFETAYWGALELTGQVHVADGEVKYAHERLPRVGTPFTIRARIVSREPLTLRAESVNAQGKRLGSLECAFKPASRAGIERAGIALPQYLLDDMAP